MNKEESLAKEPLGSLIFRLSLPAVLAQIINVLYNIVDRIFIGHIEGYGDMALTGVGVTVPIIMIISAFSAFAGMGGAPLASIELGRKNHKKAEEILGSSVFLLISFSLILTIFFQIFKTPILYAFGASSNTIGHAEDYISIYLYGTLFVQFALGLNTYITAQGQARVAMVSVLIGALTNLILDPILIFKFGLGVKGAALATVISQGLSAFWVVRFLLSENSSLKIRREYLGFNREIVGSIAMLGISPFIMQSTESLVFIVLNSGLLKYGGDLYVGSMSIIGSVLNLVNAPIHGVSQGIQPIISYNYGAGNYNRVRTAFKRMILICLLISMVLAGIAVVAPGVYANMFSDNQELVELTKTYMPVYFFGMTIFGIQQACQSTFLGLGQAKISLFIALLRKVFLLIPLAIILPKSLGVLGVYLAEPIADITSVLITSFLFYKTVQKLFRDSDGEKI